MSSQLITNTDTGNRQRPLEERKEYEEKKEPHSHHSIDRRVASFNPVQEPNFQPLPLTLSFSSFASRVMSTLTGPISDRASELASSYGDIFNHVLNRIPPSVPEQPNRMPIRPIGHWQTHFPPELQEEVASYLPLSDVLKCRQVCHKWRMDSPLPNWYPKFMFDQLLLNEKHQIPPLPPQLKELLEQPCPFTHNKQIADTHMLLYVPLQVSVKTVRLTLRGRVVATIIERLSLKTIGDILKYKKIPPFIGKTEYNSNLREASWILMTMEPMPNTLGKLPQEQNLNLQAMGYNMPIIIEAQILLAARYRRLGHDKGVKPFVGITCQEGGFGVHYEVGRYGHTGGSVPPHWSVRLGSHNKLDYTHTATIGVKRFKKDGQPF